MVRIGIPDSLQSNSPHTNEFNSSSLPDTQIITTPDPESLQNETESERKRRISRYYRVRRKEKLRELQEPSERRWLIAESKGAIANLEQDHHANTAVHLYSAHLLHRKNRRFPHSSWASWPKRLKNVPIPLTEDFVDENNPYKRSRMDAMLVPPSLISEAEFERMNKPESQETKGQNAKKESFSDTLNIPSASLWETRKVLEPKSVLSLEMDATFQRTVYKRIHNHRKKATKKNNTQFASSMVPISDPSPIMPLQAKGEIFAMIDQILECNSTTMLRTVRPTGFRTWIDIIRNHANLGRTLQRCRELFLERDPTNYEEGYHDSLNKSDKKVKFRKDLSAVTLAQIHHLKPIHSNPLPETKIKTETSEGGKPRLVAKYQTPYLQPNTYISELLESNYSRHRVPSTRAMRTAANEAYSIMTKNRERLSTPNGEEETPITIERSSRRNQTATAAAGKPYPTPVSNGLKKSDKKTAKWLDKVSAPVKYLVQSPLGPIITRSLPLQRQIDQGWMAEEGFEYYEPALGEGYDEIDEDSDEGEFYDAREFDHIDDSVFEFQDDESTVGDEKNNTPPDNDDEDDNDDQFFDPESDLFDNDDIDFHNPTSEDNEEDAELTELMDHSYKIFQSLS